MKRNLSLLIIAIICFISCNSLSEESAWFQAAFSHAMGHLNLSEEQMSEFEWELIPCENESIKIVHFYYTELSYTSFEVWVQNGERVSCTCELYTQEDYQNDVLYKQEIWPYVLKAREWEKQYGPHELWDITLNAAFYAHYGHIPYQSEFNFIMGHAHFDWPDDELITPADAFELAKQALLAQYPNARLEEMQVGSRFCKGQEKPSCYTFNFYLTEGEELNAHYEITIDSNNGNTLFAFYWNY